MCWASSATAPRTITPQAARDRDRLKEQVLLGLGWRLHRIWSIDWYSDPEYELGPRRTGPLRKRWHHPEPDVELTPSFEGWVSASVPVCCKIQFASMPEHRCAVSPGTPRFQYTNMPEKPAFRNTKKSNALGLRHPVIPKSPQYRTPFRWHPISPHAYDWENPIKDGAA